MMQTKNVRRQIVERVLKGISIKPHFAISLRNARDSLLKSCINPDSTKIQLDASDDQDRDDQVEVQKAVLDIKDEITVSLYR